MRQAICRRHGLRRSRLLFAATTAVVAGFAGRATAQNWVGTINNDWNTGGNWAGGTVPGNTSNAIIAPSTTNTFTVDYNYNGPAVTLGEVSVDRVPASGGTNTLVMASDALTATFEGVGVSGAGAINQSGGTNTISTNILNIGIDPDSFGIYNLSGTGTVSNGDQEIIGNEGAGIFNQSGGLNTLLELDIANEPGSTGTYILSNNGTLSAAREVYVGGSSFGAQGKGILTVSGGLLNTGTTGTLMVYNTTGSGFTLSGGVVSTGSLNLSGNPALFNWTAGTLDLTNLISSVTIDAAANGGNLSGNSLTLGASQELTLAGGEFVGAVGAGGLTLNGGINVVSGELDLGVSTTATGTYKISSTGALSAFIEIIGAQGTGVFNQTGGTNTVTGTNGTLALAQSSGSTGTYVLSDGTLSSPVIDVGGLFAAGGKGVLTVSGGMLTTGPTGVLTVFNSPGSGVTLNGGTISVGSLNVSGTFGMLNWSSGTLNFINSSFAPILDTPAISGDLASNLTLAAGQVLTSAGNEIVGNNGTATLTQSGGNNVVAIELAVGLFSGSSGIYKLSGTGSVSAASEVIGTDGTGLFNQTGGTNTVGSLQLCFDPNSAGTYLLGGGTLNAAQVDVGAAVSGAKGILSVSGSGLVNVSGTLAAASTPGTGITLSGGTINTAALSFDGTPSLLWTGGTLGLTAGVTFDPGAGAGTTSAAFGSILTLGIGQFLNVTGSENIGGTSSFTLHVAGGGNQISGNLNIGVNPNSTGIYNLTDGTLTAAGVIVGGSMTGPGGTGVMTVSNSAVLNFNAAGGGFLVYGGGRVNLDVPNSAAGSLAIVGNGIVNLNGALVINYGSPGNDPVTSVLSYLKSGFNGGAWTGTAGIISTSITAGSPVLSIGYADGNADPSTAAGPNQIVVRYTLDGDTNLDGLVNFADLVAVLQNFNKGGTDWAHGNFGYTVSTNFADLVAVLQNFNKTLPPPSGSAVDLGGSIIPLLPTNGVHSTDVQLPEPAMAGLLALAGAASLARRRKNGR